jgi:hypothetical protein
MSSGEPAFFARASRFRRALAGQSPREVCGCREEPWRGELAEEDFVVQTGAKAGFSWSKCGPKWLENVANTGKRGARWVRSGKWSPFRATPCLARRDGEQARRLHGEDARESI